MPNTPQDSAAHRRLTAYSLFMPISIQICKVLLGLNSTTYLEVQPASCVWQILVKPDTRPSLRHFCSSKYKYTRYSVIKSKTTHSQWLRESKWQETKHKTGSVKEEKTGEMTGGESSFTFGVDVVCVRKHRNIRAWTNKRWLENSFCIIWSQSTNKHWKPEAIEAIESSSAGGQTESQLQAELPPRCFALLGCPVSKDLGT